MIREALAFLFEDKTEFPWLVDHGDRDAGSSYVKHLDNQVTAVPRNGWEIERKDQT